MKRTKRALAMMAFTTLFGCSSQFSAVTVTPMEVETLRVYSTTATIQLVSDLTMAYRMDPLRPRFETASGTYSSIVEQLLSNNVAYLVTSHLPDNLSLWSAPIAQDGIAIITHTDNPVQTLSVEQVRQIYQGLLTNWREVGGINAPIVLMSREDGSDIRSEFERQVMGQRRITPTTQIIPSQNAMISQITEISGAIGYTSLSSIDSRFQVITVNGVLPSQKTVLDHTYPLRSTIFMVGLQEPSGSYLQFFNWIQGVEGQKIIRQRYAPLPR